MFALSALNACLDAVSTTCAATSSIAIRHVNLILIAPTVRHRAALKATARIKSCAMATKASEILARTLTSA